ICGNYVPSILVVVRALSPSVGKVAQKCCFLSNKNAVFNVIEFGNVSEFAFSKGEWLLFIPMTCA
ncbi:hypothetical protein AB4283_21620, partial [Vibrio splendidus]